jgi:hypothetical protein
MSRHHLITSLDGQLSSTPWVTFDSEMNYVWVTDRDAANAHCQSKTSVATSELATAKAGLDKYGTLHKHAAHTHCQTIEDSMVKMVNNYTDGKNAWIDQQLSGRMKKP